MRSKALWAVVLLLCEGAFANQPGDKRTILTSGESVHTIRYQLGQSTVLYLGLKPETVICGNKNYFNIEKIKEGITIQPLANFSTNLTIMDGGHRYLFYLTPAYGKIADTFIDVKWVDQGDVLPVERFVSAKSLKITEINQRVRVTRELDLLILRQKSSEGSKNRIFEMELKNQSSVSISTERIAVIAMNGNKAVAAQTMVWESEDAKGKKSLRGRLILGNLSPKAFDLVIRYKGFDTRTTIKGIGH